ncbi:hypothetical protein Tco_1573269, partial [Tanacetum coccineum]
MVANDQNMLPEEATCDLDDDEADVEGQSGSAMKKKRGYIVDESAS